MCSLSVSIEIWNTSWWYKFSLSLFFFFFVISRISSISFLIESWLNIYKEMLVFISSGRGWVKFFFLVLDAAVCWFLALVFILVIFLSEILIISRYSSSLFYSSTFISLIGVTKSWHRLKGSSNLSIEIKSKGCLIFEDYYEIWDFGYVLLGELNSLSKSWSKLI